MQIKNLLKLKRFSDCPKKQPPKVNGFSVTLKSFKLKDLTNVENPTEDPVVCVLFAKRKLCKSKSSYSGGNFY